MIHPPLERKTCIPFDAQASMLESSTVSVRPNAWIGHDRNDLSSEFRTLIEAANRSPAAFFARNSLSFSFAARNFPAEMRATVRDLYAFCRITDDIVDMQPDKGRAAKDMQRWARMSRLAYEGSLLPAGLRCQPLERIMRQSAQARVPYSLIEALIEGVRSDVRPQHLADGESLRRYCYGVASSVGLWMSHLSGMRDPQVLVRAELLGYAMQITNILRDVGEDFREGRIYVPATLMAKHGITIETLQSIQAGSPIPQAYIDMLEELMQLAEACYERAFEGLAHMPASFSRAVGPAAEIYRGILKAIREAGYDNFHQRAKTTRIEKIQLSYRALRRLQQAEARSLELCDPLEYRV